MAKTKNELHCEVLKLAAMPSCLGGGEYETNPVRAGPIAPWRFESSLHSSLNNKPSRVASALRLAAFFI